MTDIILSGCLGKLGSAICKIAENDTDIKIVAGVDINYCDSKPFPVFSSFSELPLSSFDAVVDVSHPSAVGDILNFVTKHKKTVLLAVTGYNAEQVRQIEAAAKIVPVFMAPNLSIGISLISKLARTAAEYLSGSYDIEIVEAHHNQKLDAPSGTALSLYSAISEALPFNPEPVYSRHEKRQKRAKNEIGIHSIRGGTVPGEHEIIFAGHDEVIKISHSALSKDIFAVGALNAAKFIVKRDCGLYGMEDMLS
ncbi:MAG: 4-hydroxy-tetrahydrodipicolinate reductase [Oscillospiraceae bacterium]|nr:4-hydroxy-tetrahydrodipicolinate reductase [Oscillospiraceae bacterium]